MTNSKQKGSRGEREAAKYLISLGVANSARRSRQYQGVVDEKNSADLIHDIDGVRLEIKIGYDSEQLYGQVVKTWIDTIRAETPPNENWALLWRKTRKKWLILFDWNGIVCQSADVKGILERIKK